MQRNSCKLENGNTGLCCPDVNPLPAKVNIGTRCENFYKLIITFLLHYNRSDPKKILKLPNGITENKVETTLSDKDTDIR